MGLSNWRLAPVAALRLSWGELWHKLTARQAGRYPSRHIPLNCFL